MGEEMRKLAGLFMIIVGLCMACVGMEDERFIVGITGIGITIAGLLITWKAENVS